MIKTHYDFLDNEIPVFGLHGFTGEQCDCGNPECESLGKHPITSNWQHTPLWSDEQLECMESMDHFKSGYGVLVKGLLVVDVDARNGGVASFEKLCKNLQVDLLSTAGLAVATGSGQGSMHLYFKNPGNESLLQHHNSYPGIDLKSTGYVVGPESNHASGNKYEILHGSPSDIEDAPPELLAILKRPEHHRSEHNGEYVDVTDADIRDMLSHISPDAPHDEWLSIGMAIHETTGGAGLDLWDEWSSNSDKYPGVETIEKRWHSFGKSANPITIGTLIHHAKENGWQSSYDDVTFTPSKEHALQPEFIDLNRPPGFVGEVAKWINDQCLYPRESLATAAALSAIGNIVGLRYTDEQDNFSTNLFTFCVAGSSTGKEAVQQAYMKIMRAAGIAGALHGSFKSEQEVIRNLMRHQMAAYVVDELGITLKKVKNAQQRGGASYLEGLIGMLMSAYSKASGFMPISGDVREEITNILQREASQLQKKIDEDGESHHQARLDRVLHALSNIDNGLEAPFLSIMGFTTPVTFNDLFDFEQATNGFLSRAFIFNDLETNPRRKQGFTKRAMSDSFAGALSNLYAPGVYSVEPGQRIEYYGDKTLIKSTPEALQVLDEVYERFWLMAEQHKSASGLEAIPRRGYELVGKVSTILAAPSGLRTDEHVRWAFALAKRDIEYKLKLAYANMKEESDEKTDAVRARIMNCVTKDHGETEAVLINRCRPHAKELVQECIKKLLGRGSLIEKTTTASNGRKSTRYFEGG